MPEHPSTLRRTALLWALEITDLAAVSSAFLFALAWSTGQLELSAVLSVQPTVGDLLLFVALLAVAHFIFRGFGLYRSTRLRGPVGTVLRAVKASVLVALVLAAGASLLDVTAIDRRFVLSFFVVSLCSAVLVHGGLRSTLRWARRGGRNLRHVLIVGSGQRGSRLGAALWSAPALGYNLLGYCDDLEAPHSPLHSGTEKHLGRLDDIEAILEENCVDEVFIALPLRSHYETVSRITRLCEELGLPVRLPADLFELNLAKSDVGFLGDQPMLSLRTPEASSFDVVSKRLLDLVVAGLAAVLVTPLAVVIALAIKLDSRGPVLFRQARVGLGGRRFQILKFRTMYLDAEDRLSELEHANEVDGAAFKMRDDPRVTRMGRFLRKTSLDELPQLLNVLSGEMSLVGPRPLPERDVERLEHRWQRRRFSVRPGITGLWQANARHRVAFERWMEMDLQYVDNWSLSLDLKILWNTLPALVRGTGS